MSKICNTETIHASCVAVGNAAVLILGASGSGKSALALELMSRGALLVADDRTVVEMTEFGVKASCPSAIQGQIEARGIGILAAEFAPWSFVRLVVDLDAKEMERLPVRREYLLLGTHIPLLHNPECDYFAAAILQYLKAGRSG